MDDCRLWREVLHILKQEKAAADAVLLLHHLWLDKLEDGRREADILDPLALLRREELLGACLFPVEPPAQASPPEWLGPP
jgi:hypothetical protein